MLLGHDLHRDADGTFKASSRVIAVCVPRLKEQCA